MRVGVVTFPVHQPIHAALQTLSQRLKGDRDNASTKK